MGQAAFNLGRGPGYPLTGGWLRPCTRLDPLEIKFSHSWDENLVAQLLKVKVNLNVEQAMKAHRLSRVEVPLFL